MTHAAYPVTLEAEADGSAVTATFDGLSGVTWGATEAEALAHAEDLLVSVLATFVEDGKPLPPPPAAHGRPVIAVPALEAAKLALHEAMIADGVSNVVMGRRLGLDEKAVRRLRDPLHRSHIGEVERALRTLGKRLEVSIRDTP